MAIRSGDPPHPAQRLLSKKRAPEREERLVYVGALVIPHAQPPKLTEPGKCALHDPPPPAQATPMLGTADGQQGHNVASPETAPNGGRVVAAIPDHTVRRCRGRPRSSCSGGIASTNASASCESFRFAPQRGDHACSHYLAETIRFQGFCYTLLDRFLRDLRELRALRDGPGSVKVVD